MDTEDIDEEDDPADIQLGAVGGLEFEDANFEESEAHILLFMYAPVSLLTHLNPAPNPLHHNSDNEGQNRILQEIENLSKKVDQLKFDQKQSDSDGLDMNTDEVQKLRMKASRSVHEICNLNEH